MSGNLGDHGSLETGETTTREADMDAFDHLDPRLRAFVSKLPMAFDCREILELQLSLGVEETLRQGEELVRSTFPDWTPI